VAPLNPAYRAQELAFYLEDIRADAVVIDARLDTPAREVARELGVGVFELTADGRASLLRLASRPARSTGDD
jgi:hypothetical protein